MIKSSQEGSKVSFWVLGRSQRFCNPVFRQFEIVSSRVQKSSILKGSIRSKFQKYAKCSTILRALSEGKLFECSWEKPMVFRESAPCAPHFLQLCISRQITNQLDLFLLFSSLLLLCLNLTKLVPFNPLCLRSPLSFHTYYVNRFVTLTYLQCQELLSD